MSAAPTGTVTFLFTDIEGSTRLWDSHPDEMSRSQAFHDTLLHEAIAARQGYVFSRAGDGVGASFASPVAALQTALAVQQGISAREWPQPIELRVRMGVHIGTAEERDGDYYGTAVNRAARVAAAGAGGQILVTDAVRALVLDGVPPDWAFRDLGEHRLRDLARAERLWQVLHPALPDVAAVPPRTGQRAGNLPAERSPLLGREEDVARLTALLAEQPLVTLTGVGGVGKTKLARSVARAVSGRYPGGAWFVDLAAVADGTAVPAAVSTTIGVTERAAMGVLDSLLDALGTERSLLLLDNAEHVVDGVAHLTDAILSRGVDCTMLVTSRETLRVEGEVVMPLPPLTVGSSDSAAAALFAARARRVAPDLLFGDADEAAVREICSRLDGLPLAIELAAAQCDTLSPVEILEALESGRLALRSVARHTAERHASLLDTIRWSYDLLDETERVVFDRMAVFAGGCHLDAARAVCSDDTTVTPDEVTRALRMLARKSMVAAVRGHGTTRFALLETLRRFAADRLAARGEVEQIRRAHAAWYAGVCREARAGFDGPQEPEHVTRILAELGNVRTALSWAVPEREIELIGGMGSCLSRLFFAKMRPEFLEWAAAALSVLPPGRRERIPFADIASLGLLIGGRAEEAVAFVADATRGLEDDPAARVVRGYIGTVAAAFSGDTARVVAERPALIDLMREQGESVKAASCGAGLALSLLNAGDRAGARAVAAGSRRLADESGSPSMRAWAAYTAGEVEAEVDPEQAIALLEEGIEAAISVENDFAAGISLVALAATAGRHGDAAIALDAMERCLGFIWDAGNRPQLWTAIRNLVELLHRIGRDDDALTLHTAAETHSRQAPDLIGPHGDRYREVMRAVEAGLGAERASAARARGAVMDYEAAVEFALAVTRRSRPVEAAA